MKPLPDNLSEPKNISKAERKWQGTPVSKGIARGKIVRLHGSTHKFYRVAVTTEENLVREVRRYRAALRLTRHKLKKIKQKTLENFRPEQSYIFDAHLLMLEDKQLTSSVEELIKTQKVNAEWALKVIGDELLSRFDLIDNDYLRERRSDVADVLQRLQEALQQAKHKPTALSENAVLCAEEIHPTTFADLDTSRLSAILCEHGGWTSHTFILARELNLPAVTGLKKFYGQARTGEDVLIDGFTGEVYVNPSAETLAKYAASLLSKSEENFYGENCSESPQTLDGTAISIYANLDAAVKSPNLNKYGIKNIGLYRTEYLLTNGRIPSEREQKAVYQWLSELVGKDGRANVRLFDLNYAEISGENAEAEKNPALGMRGIRLAYKRRDILETQLRAILQASVNNNLRIIAPMVSDVSEMDFLAQAVAEQREFLQKKGVACGEVQLGAMLEVPSAAWQTGVFARQTDCLCLGTNDLVQYLLAVDRDNRRVSSWFSSLHPSVIRCLKQIFDESRDFETPLIVCGEMASSPVYSVILLGLGAKNFSMNLAAVGRVGTILRNVKRADAAQICQMILETRTAKEAEQLVRNEFTRRWSQMFTPEIFS